MRFLVFAFVGIGCGGTVAGGNDAGTKVDAATDGPTTAADAGFTSSLVFEDNGQGLGSFSGAFFATAQQASGGCEQTVSGACQVYMCPDVGPQSLPTAGTLTLSVSGVTATVMPNTQNGTYTHTLTFAPGDVLGVSASGGDVPAFTTPTITSPGKLTVPTLPTTISTAQDFTLTWTGGEPGATVAITIDRGAPNATVGVSCNFDAMAGTGTVPQAQLAILQTGSPSGDLVIGQSRSAKLVSGAFAIDLSALEYQGQIVTFQ